MARALSCRAPVPILSSLCVLVSGDQILMRTLIVLPRSFGALLEANVSLGRLQAFFDLPERSKVRVPIVLKFHPVFFVSLLHSSR